jgi:hypothetical protein
MQDQSQTKNALQNRTYKLTLKNDVYAYVATDKKSESRADSHFPAHQSYIPSVKMALRHSAKQHSL